MRHKYFRGPALKGAGGAGPADGAAQAQLSRPQVMGAFPYLGRGGSVLPSWHLNCSIQHFGLLEGGWGEATQIYPFRWMMDALRLSISLG